MRKFFDYTLLMATIAPLLLTVIANFGINRAAAIDLLLAHASIAHVFATGYLLSDPMVRSFFLRERFALIAVPIAAAIGGFAMLALAPLWVAFVFVLFYVHYQAYHFGQQNLGVASFSSIGNRDHGITAFERTTIRLGVLCGILGTYHALAPNLMLIPSDYPFDVALTNKWLLPLFKVGLVLYGAVLVAAVAHAILNLRSCPRYAALYLCSVAFFLPIYVSQDPGITFASYAVAHGLQYVVFLEFHASGRHPRLPPLIAMALLLPLIVVSYFAWSRMDVTLHYVVHSAALVKVTTGVLWGITLAHFWVDQCLWKLRLGDRRQWVMDRYAFLFKPAS